MNLARKFLNFLLNPFLLLIAIQGVCQQQFPFNKEKHNSRITNACGVIAVISPGYDSVVTNPATVINFTSASINAISYQFTIDGSPYAANSPVNTGFNVGLTVVRLIARNGSCADTATSYYFRPGTFPTDLANVKLYYGIPSRNQSIKDFISVSSGGYLMAADRDPTGYPTYLPEQCYLTKTSESGCIEWSKILDSSNNGITKVSDIEEGPGGNFYIVASIDNDIPVIIKMNSGGNLIWSKIITTNTGLHLSPAGMKVLPDGSIVLASNYLNGTVSVLTRLDNNGNVMWRKEFAIANQVSSGFRYIEQKDTFLYISGTIRYTESANDIYANLVMKVDLASGQTIWLKRYVSPIANISLRDIHNSDTMLVINTITSSLGIPGYYNVSAILSIDTAGNVIKSAVISEIGEYYMAGSQLIALPGRKYYMLSYGSLPLSLQPYIAYKTKVVKLDSAFNVLWDKTQGAIQLGQYYYAATNADQTLALAGDENGRGLAYWASWSKKAVVRKIDSLGGGTNYFCDFGNPPMIVTPIAITPQSFDIATDMLINSSVSNTYPVALHNFYPEFRFTCPEDYVDSCGFLVLTGPSSICNLNDIYSYKVHKNKSCSQPVQWTIPFTATVISQTDSLLTIKFNSFGNFTVAATLGFSCSPIKDSVKVHALSSSPPLNLGVDSNLCPGNTMTLHAGPNYASYQWQDNSTDSIFTATGPGEYHVQVNDSCGNILKDTINIFNSPSVPLSIGPDRIKCNNDTLHLIATPGFINYSWSPNYNISSINTQSVIINPLIDTVYTLIAEKSTGCYGYDTIRITTKNSAPIRLGADTSFCMGDSITLDAGNGFNQYNWNNGMNTQHITGHAAGDYIVIGITTEGCKSTDTLKVIKVFPLPIISLNPDTTICSNDIRILDAGAGYSTYLWNTGSSNQVINVNTTGTYEVTVTDNNGCKGSGNVKISTTLPKPFDFLPSDTSLCSYGTMRLFSSISYNSYLWNTGDNSHILTVTKPGLYWLQVKDKNNCTGRDSILLRLKDCMKGIFIPSAFSPNNDAINNRFKPAIFGKIKYYKFSIYNRYGKLIFYSVNPEESWDGTYHGAQQDCNVFIWICSYQFEGEIMKMEKGTVLLVR